MIGDRLAHATGGRRYCFVIMTYHADWHIFDLIRSAVGEATGLECIRADDVPAAGEDLRSRIHIMIENAAFIIADISEPRPNVYYELGYAIGRNKEALLLAKEEGQIPTDLLGLELLRYSTTKDGWARLQANLRAHLAAQVGLSHFSLLRSMIIPHDPMPSYILVNPKLPEAKPRFHYHPNERRTYGDHLGILGILRAFGSVYGEHIGPELVSAKRVATSLLGDRASFYLIGSPKVNPATAMFLAEMQCGRTPSWALDPPPGVQPKGDYEVQLSREADGQAQSPGLRRVFQPANSGEDYGLIIRGPNPRHPDRLVTILAGPHARGTGAACLAATNSRLIREIADRLPNKMSDLSDHSRTLWALVHVVPDQADLHVSPEGITILEAGIYAAVAPSAPIS